MIYQNAIEEYQRLKERIDEMERRIAELPEGRLFCVNNGGYYKWYRSNGDNQTYIPKKERKLAEQLAVKKYMSYLVKEYKQEKTALEFYLRHHNTEIKPSEKMLTDMPGYQELLAQYFCPLSVELKNWMNENYERNMSYPEQLTQKASAGKYVRSKSEVLIDMALFKNKIPFRYECALQLGETTVYPDFTIRHPKTGRTYYWEHFGMIDNPVYRKNTILKLQNYISNGIIPTIQLITTYETKENQLNMEKIEKIIKEYFG